MHDMTFLNYMFVKLHHMCVLFEGQQANHLAVPEQVALHRVFLFLSMFAHTSSPGLLFDYVQEQQNTAWHALFFFFGVLCIVTPCKDTKITIQTD